MNDYSCNCLITSKRHFCVYRNFREKSYSCCLFKNGPQKKKTVADLLSLSLQVSISLLISLFSSLSLLISLFVVVSNSVLIFVPHVSLPLLISALSCLSLSLFTARSLALLLSLSLFISLSLSFSLSCQLCPSLPIDNDSDNDHLPSRLSLCTHSSDLLCVPECVHSLIGELLALCRNKLCRCTCSDLVPLEKKWTCTCAGDGHVFAVCLCVCCAVGCVWFCVCLCLCLWSGVAWLLSSLRLVLLICSCLVDCRRCVACCTWTFRADVETSFGYH